MIDWTHCAVCGLPVARDAHHEYGGVWVCDECVPPEEAEGELSPEEAADVAGFRERLNDVLDRHTTWGKL